MERGPAALPRRQPVVLLDVGGQSFKISQPSLDRYPNSLLSKVVKEFPNLIEKGEPLFIDRNPKMFSWILEIYRCDIPFVGSTPQTLTFLQGWRLCILHPVCTTRVSPKGTRFLSAPEHAEPASYSASPIGVFKGEDKERAHDSDAARD